MLTGCKFSQKKQTDRVGRARSARRTPCLSMVWLDQLARRHVTNAWVTQVNGRTLCQRDALSRLPGPVLPPPQLRRRIAYLSSNLLKDWTLEERPNESRPPQQKTNTSYRQTKDPLASHTCSVAVGNLSATVWGYEERSILRTRKGHAGYTEAQAASAFLAGLVRRARWELRLRHVAVFAKYISRRTTS